MAESTHVAVRRARHAAQDAAQELSAVAEKHAKSVVHEASGVARHEASKYVKKRAASVLYGFFALVSFAAALFLLFANGSSVMVWAFAGIGALLWFYRYFPG